MSSYIIAGIDPGATVGIAILDLSGKRIALRSTDGGMHDTVRIIESFGTPSLIACDKIPAPETVHRIASFFSCRLYAPPRNIREDEKRLIARGSPVQNNHERDAYAACVLAYRSHANKLRQIDALADLQHEEKERIKHLLLRGYRIKDAFAAIEEPAKEESAAERTVRAPPTTHALSAEELRMRVSSLARENANLRMLVERLEKEKEQLSSRLSMLQNDMRRTIFQDSELRRLKYQLQQSLERFSPKKKMQQKQSPQKQQPAEQKQPSLQKQHPQPQKHDERPPSKDALNKLAESKLDIEKLVAEYRKKRI